MFNLLTDFSLTFVLFSLFTIFFDWNYEDKRPISHARYPKDLQYANNITKSNDASEEPIVKDTQDFDIEELLSNQSIFENNTNYGKSIENKSILITGAAGSIGSEIARQVANYNPRRIGILDINESDLVKLGIQLSLKIDKDKIKMYLCDISDRAKVERVFEDFDPEIIFHAAAYKHIPVLEQFPEEAVRVNVIGTYNVAETAKNFEVEKFILISTDKAVNPISILGASKRIAEYIVSGIGLSSKSKFIVVRFGNVIDSRGSAVSVFIEQLKNGEPITITHPEMKRFFMTISHAVSLVLEAATSGMNNDLFILDMGESIRIIDIVRNLIRIYNKCEGENIKIVYTGIREGEKISEEILNSEEKIIKTDNPKIFRSKILSNHNHCSVKEMIDDFVKMNAFATKSDWIELFGKHVPSFKQAIANNHNTSYDETKSITV